MKLFGLVLKSLLLFYEEKMNNFNYKYPILLVFDRFYSEYTLVLIANIIERTNYQNIFFHLITDEETDFSFQESFLKSNSIKHKLYRVNSHDYNAFPTSAHITKGAYYLLNALELIEEKNKTLLYLDIDIFVIDDITEVFSYYDDRFSLNCLMSSDSNYFGSGFLLINLEKAKQLYTMNNFKNVLNKNPNINRHDQDLLNIVFNRDFVKNIPSIWNLHLSGYLVNKKFFHRSNIFLADAKSVHYPGTNKPWRFSSILPFATEWREIYFKIYNRNPWSKITPNEFMLRILYTLFPNPRILYRIHGHLRKFKRKLFI